jgi:hypothetical protein
MVFWIHVRLSGWTYTDFVEILLQHDKSFSSRTDAYLGAHGSVVG